MSKLNIDDMGTFTAAEIAVVEEQYNRLVEGIEEICNGTHLATVLPALCWVVSRVIRRAPSECQELLIRYCVGDVEQKIKDEGQVK